MTMQRKNQLVGRATPMYLAQGCQSASSELSVPPSENQITCHDYSEELLDLDRFTDRIIYRSGTRLKGREAASETHPPIFPAFSHNTTSSIT